MIYKFIQYETKSTGKQRPMVQQVLQNNKNHQAQQQSNQ